MRLQEKAVKDALDAICRKIPSGRLSCPVCGDFRFTGGGTVYQLREMRLKNETDEETRNALVWEIVCGNCGYSLFFNALKAGIVVKNTLQ